MNYRINVTQSKIAACRESTT